MNSEELRTEALRLVEEANHVGYADPKRAEGILVSAQVHATLYLADEQRVSNLLALRDLDGIYMGPKGRAGIDDQALKMMGIR